MKKHKNISAKNTGKLTKEEHLEVVRSASKEVTRGVFFSTIIIVVSFLPVFLLTGEEGKLFHPLAYTKTFILVADAILLITLSPVLLSFFMRGKWSNGERNFLFRALRFCYQPPLRLVFRFPKTTLAINIIALVVAVFLFTKTGSEFMPPLDEQDILFMPVTLPDVSNTEIKNILQTQDKIIKSMPEVDKVLGKAGRASTATDNAPMSMIETIIMLKPKSQWRTGMTKQKIIADLDARLQIPGVVNGWTQPIVNRFNMLATGIRTDVGIKIYGQNTDTIAAVAARFRDRLQGVAGVVDLYTERARGGKFIMITPKRNVLGRLGLTTDDVNELVRVAIGGAQIATTIEGRRRFPISVRVAEDYRNSLNEIAQLPIISPRIGAIPLGEVADITLRDEAPMYVSENGQLYGAVVFNVRGRDLESTVKDAMARLQSVDNKLPEGYFFSWSGQYENWLRGKQTLTWVIPIVIIIIFFTLYFAFHSLREAFVSLITLPFALIGGVVAVYIAGVNMSVAVAVGFIALFGLAVETAIVMVIYLNDAMQKMVEKTRETGQQITTRELQHYVMEGATKRLRPKIMTVCVSLFGLVPILFSTAVGADVMRPIVLPMIGGVFTSSIHILLVTPLVFLMTKQYELKKYGTILVYKTAH